MICIQNLYSWKNQKQRKKNLKKQKQLRKKVTQKVVFVIITLIANIVLINFPPIPSRELCEYEHIREDIIAHREREWIVYEAEWEKKSEESMKITK